MKKHIKILIIGAFCLGILLVATTIYATNGKIVKDVVRIREKASTDSDILTVMPVNAKVEVLGKEGEWYKIIYKTDGDTYTGYVRQDMIQVDEETVKDKNETTETTAEPVKETNTASENEAKSQPTEEVTKIEENTKINLANNVDVRILPLVNSSKIASVNAKTEVFIAEIIGNWCRIETDKISGWILTNKVLAEAIDNIKPDEKKDDSNNDEKKSTTPETKTMYVKVDALNLRKEAKTTGEIIDQLSINQKVTVLEKVDDTWSKIQVSGKTGYVATKYLSEKKSETTSRGSDETRKAKTVEQKNETKTETNTENKAEAKTVTKTETKTTEKAANTDTKTETKVTEKATNTKTETKTTDNTSSSRVTGEDVVAYAKQFLGCKYVYATAGPKTFDCSGFTTYVYKHFGYKLNRVANDQQKNGVAVKKSDLQPGDILCFRGHVGIYIGGGKFIHAENSRTGVVISSVNQRYYVQNYVTARRILK